MTRDELAELARHGVVPYGPVHVDEPNPADRQPEPNPFGSFGERYIDLDLVPPRYRLR